MTIVEELRIDRESGARRLEAEYKAGLMTPARRFCVNETDAEDLVYRTFSAIVEGIDDYLEQSAFFGWMCQFLSNLHGKDVRKKSRQMKIQLRHGARIYVGEFSAVAWAEGVDIWLRDILSVFGEYGWDWTYHAFREWRGWSVEHEGPDIGHMAPSADNPRKRALREGLRR